VTYDQRLGTKMVDRRLHSFGRPESPVWRHASLDNRVENLKHAHLKETQRAMRAAIYARYSTDMQAAASVDDQVRVCKERIAREGWSLGQIFQDRAMSAASTLRPGYQAMLAAARAGGCDVVVAEALDRLSRDQEDVAGLFKRLRFAGIKIITLAEGEITELHVGLKGTMNALFLKDLALKTHRGLRGRVEAGLSGGGNSFGYRVIRQLVGKGQVTTGQRQIDPGQAATINRIFQAYAAGTSPREIALELNRDGVGAPRTKAWSSSTINGNRARGTGILNNELYVGRLTWNRLTYMKDPETGRRRSRARPADEAVVTAVPDLQIVNDALWAAVKARQQALDDRKPVLNEETGTQGHAPFWSKQRPRYLFSGLMQCGCCGGGFSKISQEHFGCSTARNKGPTACDNRLAIRRNTLESTVLDGLADRIMDPGLFKVFVTEFTAEWNRLQAETSGDREARVSELSRVNAQIERLVDAIAAGGMSPAIGKRLADQDKRRLELEGLLAEAAAPAPRLHPNLADVYRQTVSSLIEVLARDDGAEARDAVRSLVDAIILTPEDGKLAVAVRGELASILSLSAAGRRGQDGRSPSDLAVQVKMVAGIGFEPMTFRL
jgi:site-specific DNA recombinase